MYKFYLKIIILICFFSCENRNQENKFRIELDLFSKANDSVHIYYVTNKSINFNEKESVWIALEAKKNNQKISAILPKNILVKQVRVDFGHNSKLQEVVLNKISFRFNNKKVVLKGKEIYQNFRIDETNTVLDKNNGVLKRKFNNQKAVFSLYPKGDKLFKRLNQLYSEK